MCHRIGTYTGASAYQGQRALNCQARGHQPAWQSSRPCCGHTQIYEVSKWLMPQVKYRKFLRSSAVVHHWCIIIGKVTSTCEECWPTVWIVQGILADICRCCVSNPVVLKISYAREEKFWIDDNLVVLWFTILTDVGPVNSNEVISVRSALFMLHSNHVKDLVNHNIHTHTTTGIQTNLPHTSTNPVWYHCVATTIFWPWPDLDIVVLSVSWNKSDTDKKDYKGLRYAKNLRQLLSSVCLIPWAMTARSESENEASIV